MKKYWIKLFLLLTAIAIGSIYGMVIHKYQLFPYSYVKNVYHRFQNNPDNFTPWSIGIYEGSTIFNLTDRIDLLSLFFS